METICNDHPSPPGALGHGIGRHRLAVRPDEDDRLRQYLNELASFPPLSSDDAARLAKAVEAGDETARCRLIESNLRLVVTIAKRYDQRGLPLANLIQAGNIGLGRAIDQYDWRKGLAFSNYATWSIRRAITELLKGPREADPV